ILVEILANTQSAPVAPASLWAALAAVGAFPARRNAETSGSRPPAWCLMVVAVLDVTDVAVRLLRSSEGGGSGGRCAGNAVAAALAAAADVLREHGDYRWLKLLPLLPDSARCRRTKSDRGSEAAAGSYERVRDEFVGMAAEQLALAAAQTASRANTASAEESPAESNLTEAGKILAGVSEATDGGGADGDSDSAAVTSGDDCSAARRGCGDSGSDGGGVGGGDDGEGEDGDSDVAGSPALSDTDGGRGGGDTSASLGSAGEDASRPKGTAAGNENEGIGPGVSAGGVVGGAKEHDDVARATSLAAAWLCGLAEHAPDPQQLAVLCMQPVGDSLLADALDRLRPGWLPGRFAATVRRADNFRRLGDGDAVT
ncbi:unnamed protein product, partial [Phaeothamnion confervicola]